MRGMEGKEERVPLLRGNSLRSTNIQEQRRGEVLKIPITVPIENRC